MNKIVCGVCGISYPETDTECPICGTAKTDANKNSAGSEAGYAYVKGGRFSHANVRRRNAGKGDLPRVVMPARQTETQEKPKRAEAPKQQPRQQNDTQKRGLNVVLAVVAFVLVLLIVGLCAFLVKDFIDGQKSTEPSEPDVPGITQSTAPKDARVPCSGLRLALAEKTFTAQYDKFHLSVIVTPSNTTDSIWYESADPRIATVDDKGVVTAVADGTVTIYVHCGEFTAECYITCEVGVSVVDPTQPSQGNDPTEPPVPDVELVLNRDDFTLNGYGDSHVLYTGELELSEITWSSSDETVAVVTNGKVVAVGNGNATITAEYMGQKATCQVHCTNVVISDYELQTLYGKASDFTISVGSTIKLFMVDKQSGLRIQSSELTFSLSKEGVITIDEEGKITALATGSVTVTVTYGDQTLKAKVHVRSAG